MKMEIDFCILIFKYLIFLRGDDQNEAFVVSAKRVSLHFKVIFIL